MAESTVIEWLDENRYRAYPLINNGDPALSLTNGTQPAAIFNIFEMIVDANLVFDALPAKVSLVSIVVNDTTAEFNITQQAPFTVDLTGNFPSYVRNSTNSLLVFSDANARLLGFNKSIRPNNIAFEPAVCTELSNELLGVNALVFNNTSPLTGMITLVDGYQFSAIPNNQTLQIEVGPNHGRPLPCGNFKTNSSDCNTIVSNINGASPVKSGDPLTFLAGPHIKIFDDPDLNRLYIGLDFIATDIASNKLLP